MLQEEHDVQDHSSHQEGVAVRVGDQETKCGTFRAEACDREECLEELIGIPGGEAMPVERVSQALR